MTDRACPTCGASGSEMCRRGRRPNGGAGIFASKWYQGIPFPEGHDSRRSVNPPQVGDLVQIKKTMLYNGRVGILGPISDDPEDPWSFTVTLRPDGRKIGVFEWQIKHYKEPK